MTELAIVIVSYNAREELNSCLKSLTDHPPITPHKIVIVDNGSPDGNSKIPESNWRNVDVIDAGGNLGFSRAVNLGIRSTASQLLLLLNSDTSAPPGAVDHLVGILRSRPDVTVVGPRLVDAKGNLEISFGSMISPFTELWQKSLVRGHARRLPFFTRLAERRAQDEHTVDWVSGACLLVRRVDAEAVGLFDERFFLYTEDVDFCAAVRNLGGRILFTPTVEILHHRGRSGRYAPFETSMAYNRSHLAFYQKHYPTWHPVLRMYLRLRGRLPRNEIGSGK